MAIILTPSESKQAIFRFSYRPSTLIATLSLWRTSWKGWSRYLISSSSRFLTYGWAICMQNVQYCQHCFWGTLDNASHTKMHLLCITIYCDFQSLNAFIFFRCLLTIVLPAPHAPIQVPHLLMPRPSMEPPTVRTVAGQSLVLHWMCTR